MISYAQRREDHRIWELLKEKETGFYLDIGCSDWKQDSVSYFFYDGRFVVFCEFLGRYGFGLGKYPRSFLYFGACSEVLGIGFNDVWFQCCV